MHYQSCYRKTARPRDPHRVVVKTAVYSDVIGLRVNFSRINKKG